MFFISRADNAGMTLEETRCASVLSKAVEEFDQNRVNATVIRKVANDNPDLFCSLSFEMLLVAPETPGYRFLALQLAKQPALFNLLTNPWGLTNQQAIVLAGKLLKVDPTLDIRLARLLPERTGVVNSDTLQGGAAERALDILDAISAGSRLVPILNHLIEHPDKKISSKAAILVGKRVQNLNWAARVISEGGDARTRANAIESIWGANSEGALKLFRASLRDPDNRVVGNSIVGLQLAGDPDVSKVIIKFAEGFEPQFRMTAAWAMGRFGDPLFVPILAPLVKDVHPGVRRAALQALHGIKRAETQSLKELQEPAEPKSPEITPEPELETVPAREGLPVPSFGMKLQ